MCIFNPLLNSLVKCLGLSPCLSDLVLLICNAHLYHVSLQDIFIAAAEQARWMNRVCRKDGTCPDRWAKILRTSSMPVDLGLGFSSPVAKAGCVCVPSITTGLDQRITTPRALRLSTQDPRYMRPSLIGALGVHGHVPFQRKLSDFNPVLCS